MLSLKSSFQINVKAYIYLATGTFFIFFQCLILCTVILFCVCIFLLCRFCVQVRVSCCCSGLLQWFCPWTSQSHWGRLCLCRWGSECHLETGLQELTGFNLKITVKLSCAWRSLRLVAPTPPCTDEWQRTNVLKEPAWPPFYFWKMGTSDLFMWFHLQRFIILLNPWLLSCISTSCIMG